jgi:hypothetical protein
MSSRTPLGLRVPQVEYYCSKALVNLYQTTRSYFLEDCVFQNVDYLTTLFQLLDYTSSTEQGIWQYMRKES